MAQFTQCNKHLNRNIHSFAICPAHQPILQSVVSVCITSYLQYHGAPLLFTDILSYMNLTFTLCFTVECILKLISYGPGVNSSISRTSSV